MRAVGSVQSCGQRRPLVRRSAAMLAILMVATLAGSVPALGAPRKEWTPPVPKDVAGVAVSPVPATPRPVWTADKSAVRTPPAVTWPAPGAAVANLTAIERAGPAIIKAQAGNLPVWVSRGEPADDSLTPGKAPTPTLDAVRVRVHDRSAAARAGVGGVLLAIGRADGVGRPDSATVSVDYSGFARAYGGDWTTRLRLVSLPACAMSTPDSPGCQGGRGLPTTNDANTRTVTAVVPVPASGETHLAVTAGPAGDNGDYKATSLSAASTWQVSAQTGDFTWSYPMKAPAAVGGPEPSLSLSYSAGSVDGRTGTSNTQGSWIGDGWDMWPGYIERKYKTCSEDRDPVGGQDPNNKDLPTGDQCWVSLNGTMSLNGRSTELVRAADGRWRGVSDDGSRVELLTDASFANGDNDNEYWKVTTTDGVQYFFGRHRRPGWTAGQAETNSVWTVPVYGNHPGEPCHTATFQPGHCGQAWRWNLDYVLDQHGTTMTYFYARETGAYGREANPSLRTTYTRGGYLTSIEYGSRTESEYTVVPAAKVVFDVADRCLTACWSGSTPVQANWPDTPWDQYCTAAPCTDQAAPTFWTSKRLTTVRTQIRSGGGTYSEVQSWTLRHEFLNAGEIEGTPMWLRGLTRIGHVGTAVTDPEITFNPGADPLENRVDGPNDGRTKLARWRIHAITTESGAQIGLTYAARECTRSALPTPHTNTKRCFPQYYAPEGLTPTLDWFHKYVVARMDVHDQTGASNSEQYNYDYLTGPAWHYDDSELVDPKKRTWGQFRGFGKVRVRKGLETGVQSATEYLYFRGMDEDKQPSGVRDVSVTDSQGVSFEDHESYNGMVREETVYNGLGGAWVSGTFNSPVRQGPTATSGALKAWMTNTGTVRKRTALEGGGTRWTRTDTRFNTDNLPYEVDDLGDESTAADDLCVRSEYARNAGIWMLNRVKRVETVGVRCATAPSRPADVLSDQRSFYDDPTAPHGTLPTKGDVVKTDEAGSWSGSTPVYVTTARTVFDANGRDIEQYDALARKSTTAYTPALAGPVTQHVVTNPAGHATTETIAPAWQFPTKIVNANGHTTELVYDAVGRLTHAWLPGRNRGAGETANLEFAYLVRNTAPSAVTTRKLLPTGTTYLASITLYDAALRERQVQKQAPGGGRVLTDAVYDSRGLLSWKSAEHYDQSGTAPSTTLVTTSGQPIIPTVTEYLYDGAGRQTAEILKAYGTEKWRTTTVHGGDRVHLTPPAGGTATTSLSDARGNAIELRQYHAATPTGSYDTTRYTYTKRGELATITDAAGNVRRNTYDQRGRKVVAEDPDKGSVTMTYDAAGQLLTESDARGVTLAYTHDALGRKTSRLDGSATGTKLAEWVYDTLSNGIGKLTRSIRYSGTNQYVLANLGYDTAGRLTGNRVTIPAAETGLAGTYDTLNTYKPDGSIATTTLPAAGDLAAEKLTFNYNDVGAQSTYLSPLSIYVFGLVYDKLSQVTQRTLGPFGTRTSLTYTIDEPTARLMETLVTPEVGPVPAKFTYGYDNVGNLTRLSDAPPGQTADTQCYKYDRLRRLVDAWTPSTGNCGPAPTVAGLGGPAKYWHSYQYEPTGNRTREVQHAATDTVRTYTYPAAGGVRPHTLSRVDTTGGASGSVAYAYDAAGNTTTRGGQTLTWDKEGHLATVVEPAGTNSYLYDADGNRLIRRDPTGKTLYLPGSSELRYTTSTGAKTCTRYYSHLGTTIATRTAAGVSWIANDHHNTAELTFTGSTMTPARRRTLPFGDQRGATTGTWPTSMDKGFVGGTKDPTGLTHVGAREYEPATGRFISVDPVIDHKDPQQMHGYSYANNNPTTLTDPDGLWPKWVKQAAGAVGNAAKDAGKWAYDHAGEISTVAGIAAAVCAVVPPLQVVAPVLAGISVAAGALATVKACKSGNAVDCGVNAVSLIPGGAVFKGLRHVSKLKKGLDLAEDGVKWADNMFNDAYRAVRDFPGEAHRRALRELTTAREEAGRALQDARWERFEAWEKVEDAHNWVKQWEPTEAAFLLEKAGYYLDYHVGTGMTRHEELFGKKEKSRIQPVPPTSAPVSPSGGGGGRGRIFAI